LESDLVLANTATAVATFGLVVPGLAGGYNNLTDLTSDALGSTLVQNNGLCPVPSVTGSYRAVAACIQLMYPGTELNRSGVVAVGVVPAGNFLNNAATGLTGGNVNTTAATVRTLCQHVERMPTGMVECKWFPGENDSNEVVSNSNQSAVNWSGRNALVFSASGFPVNTGVRVRTVVVYEVSLTTTGAVQSVAPPTSDNSPNQVLRAMAQRNPQWYIESAAKFGRAVGSAISYVSAGAKAAGMFVNGMALAMG